jgi:hypothetical protein
MTTATGNRARAVYVSSRLARGAVETVLDGTGWTWDRKLSLALDRFIEREEA